MRQKYTLKLTPTDGPTLLKRTKDEWSLGYMFKVLASDLAAFRRGSFITIEDVSTHQHYYSTRFDIEFEHLSVRKHLEQQAEVNHSYRRFAKNNNFKLSNRGQ